MSELETLRKAVPCVQNGNVIISEASRCSFPTIFEFQKSKKYPDRPPEARISILIPEDSPMVAVMQKEIKRLLLKKCDGEEPHKWRNPMRHYSDYDPKKYPEYEGHWIFKTQKKPDARVPKDLWVSLLPKVLDKSNQQILDPSEIYSGCVVRIKFELFAYDGNNGAGVSSSLHVVQKIADMEPFGGAAQAVDTNMPDLELPDLGDSKGDMFSDFE